MTTPPNTPRQIPEDIHQQLALYFDNQATDEVVQAIQDWLEQDPVNAHIFAEYGSIERMIYCAQKTEDASAVFALLQEMEDAADEELVTLSANPPAAHRPARDRVTFREAASTLGYLLGGALKSKPAFVAYAAAVVLLLAALLIPWGNSEDPTDNRFATAPREPGRDGPAHNNPIVANLTAEHDAVWERRPGRDLYAGQRLTLTAGFAEIKTADGAVAIIEAPATLQFINNNALRLHTGKLVGICETESSKGFVVRTPHMDITDLGTRFGVDSNSRSTEVHVFEGEVQARSNNTAPGTAPTLLVANQSARTSADTDVIARIDHDADRFAALLPTTIELPGTGQGVTAKKIDPNWQIIAIDGQPLPNPRAVIAGQLGSNIDASKPTQWLSMRTRGMRFENDQASFLFRTSLDLPVGVQPGKHRLAIRYMADNELRSVRVNGQALETNIPQPESIRDFSPPIRFEITPELQAGANVIEFEVIDHAFEGASGAYVGLYIDWELLPLAGSQDP